MKHLSEHTIEQYVLGGSTKRERNAVKKHLDRCPGCRELEQRMRSFYASVEEELGNFPGSPGVARNSLVRAEREIDLWRSYQPPAAYQPAAGVTWWQRARGTIRQRPLASVVGSLSLIGAITLAIAYSATSLFKDKNPSFVHYNLNAGMMEVYNKENTRLWEMPSDFLPNAKDGDESNNMKSTIVADLKGNGQNLVVTTVRMASDPNASALRIIDGTMTLLAKIEYGPRRVQFRQQQYDAQFNPFQPIIARTGKNGDIFVISNNGRSPCVVTRYDPSGKVLGEYWHFGNFRAGYAVNLNNDDKEELILIGGNDVGPGEANNYPVIAVLDPSKISGESEATSTRGFGFPPSQAELYYIRLNLDEICHDFESYTVMEKLESSSENVLRFAAIGYAPDRGFTFPNFEFIFDKRLNPVEVKNEDQTVREVARLKREGKTSIVLDAAYLEKIKRAIRYLGWEKMDRRQEEC